MSESTRPLRIALVFLHTSPGTDPGSGDAGGMNVVVRHQAEAMAAAGHSVQILTRRSGPGPSEVALADGLALRFLDAGPARPVAKGDHESFVADFGARLDEIGPVDLFHSHHWFSGVAAVPVARRRGVPHVQSFHSIAADARSPLSDGERPESPGRLRGEAWLARESDALVAISDAEASTIVHRLGGRADRVTVVPPGVDGTLFRAPTSGRPAGCGYAVVAARLQPLKGLDLAIETLAQVPEAVRPDLVIAGDASADFAGYIDELRALAARRGVEDRVRFIGPQSREGLADLLRSARAVLVPSHSETYGLVALEGASSAVPVIAAASGGLREAVVDGLTGIVLDSRDPAVWGAALTELLTDDVLAARLSAAGRLRAEQLDWPRSAAALVEVYRRLLGGGSRQEPRAVA